MYTVTIRFNEGEFFALLEGSAEIEGIGETISDALRDLADNIESLQI